MDQIEQLTDLGNKKHLFIEFCLNIHYQQFIEWNSLYA